MMISQCWATDLATHAKEKSSPLVKTAWYAINATVSSKTPLAAPACQYRTKKVRPEPEN